MQNQNTMKKMVFPILLMLISVSMANAQIRESPCAAHCQGLSGNPLQTCLSNWDDVHDYHSGVTGGACTNYSSDLFGNEGECGISWLNGANGFLQCDDGNCTITGQIKCGGQLRNYEISCGGVQSLTRAAVQRDSAQCHGDGGIAGTMGNGPQGYSNTVQCDGESGNLIYGIWGN